MGGKERDPHDREQTPLQESREGQRPLSRTSGSLGCMYTCMFVGDSRRELHRSRPQS